MKKLISIALIISIAAPFWISYSIIQYQKYIVKKEIKKQIINGIDINELTLLEFSKIESQQKLEWEHSREFEYNGKMYDIVESKVKDDSVYYWCWEDNEETELNIKLNTLAEKDVGSNNTNNENLKRLSNFLFSLFYSNEDPFNTENNKKSSSLSAYYINNYLSLPTNPLTPPPKNIFS